MSGSGSSSLYQHPWQRLRSGARQRPPEQLVVLHGSDIVVFTQREVETPFRLHRNMCRERRCEANPDFPQDIAEVTEGRTTVKSNIADSIRFAESSR